jgi:hypothetical protein
MTTYTWPSSLPTSPLVGSYSGKPVMPKASFESDAGPPIARPKSTLKMVEHTLALMLTDEELSTLEDFVFWTLSHASANFHFLHPRTNEQILVRLVGDQPYEVSWMAPGYWRVSFTMLQIR